MILIDGKIVSIQVISAEFKCKISTCKGACCYEGDYGAPLKEEEMETLNSWNDWLADYLPEQSIQYLEKEAPYTYFKEKNMWGTPLHEDGSCVFLFSEGGISFCSIEKAFSEGNSPMHKPISCHLYPIRVKTDTFNGMDILEYDQWDICSSACNYGKKTNTSLIEFSKEALIRAYGKDFFEELSQVADDFNTTHKENMQNE